MDERLKEENETLVLDRLKAARTKTADWREEARDSYDFVSGRQWDSDDEALLKAESRPAITFNYIEKMVDAVCGMEVANRQVATYLPREMGDTGLATILNGAAQWVRDECAAEDEESDLFRDAVICGIGWTETRMDFSSNPDGMIVVERRDPLDMYFDPNAVKKNLSDAKFVFHGDWMAISDVEERWPDIHVSSEAEEDAQPHDADNDRFYKNNQNDKRRGQVRVWHYQCVKREAQVRLSDNGKWTWMPKDRFDKIKDSIDVPFIEQTRDVYYRGFVVGKTLVEYGESPYKEGFTFKAVTAKRDRNQRMWYGLVRVMKDPQRWANKWLSQILHIINSNTKGGAFAEEGAFKNPRKAEEEWAQANPLITLNEGGLNKIKERNPAAYPAGLDRLMSFAFESLPMVTGINLEAMGLANREQAGVVESSRKEAVYGLLAPVFDSLRRYRKDQGKALLYFIKEYISDGRLVRINGQNADQQYIPLVRQETNQTYDIIVDQAPNSPDFRKKIWENLSAILPTMMKQGLPIPPSLLDYSPLPASLSKEWQQYIQEKSSQPSMEQIQKLQQQLQQTQQELQKVRQEHQKMLMDNTIEMEKLKLKAAESAEEAKLAREKAIDELALKREIAEAELELDKIKIGAQADNQKLKIKGDMAVKSIEIGKNIDPEEDDRLKAEAELVQQAKLQAVIDESRRQSVEIASAIVAELRRPKTKTGIYNGKKITVTEQ